MHNVESQLRPGESMPEYNLYENRVNAETLEEIGVNAPDGKFYPFLDGEKFSLDRKGEFDREPIIIKKDGTRISFKEWVGEPIIGATTEEQEILNRIYSRKPSAESIKEKDKRFTWNYNKEKGVVVGPNGETRDLENLSYEEMFTIVVEIRRDIGHPPRWPNGIAEKITKRFLAERKTRYPKSSTSNN